MGTITDAAPATRASDRAGGPGVRRHPRGPEHARSSSLPFLVVFGVFAWFPILRGVVMSVQETNLVSEPTFVGLENFRARPRRPAARRSPSRNTLWFMALAFVFGFPSRSSSRS